MPRTGSFRSAVRLRSRGTFRAFRSFRFSACGIRSARRSGPIRTRAGPWRRRALRGVYAPAFGNRSRRPLSKDPAREAAGRRSPCRARAGFLAGSKATPGNDDQFHVAGTAVSPVTGSCTPKRAFRRSFPVGEPLQDQSVALHDWQIDPFGPAPALDQIVRENLARAATSTTRRLAARSNASSRSSLRRIASDDCRLHRSFRNSACRRISLRIVFFSFIISGRLTESKDRPIF